jgi:hypothetical protein
MADESLNEDQIKDIVSRDNAQKDQYDAQVAAELAKLGEYRKALEEEFKGADPEKAETAMKVLKRVVELVPDAGTTISYLLNHAESESVRATLAKFVVTVALRAAEKSGDDDELTRLVNELTGASKS